MKDQLITFDTAKLAKEKGFGLGENDYCQTPYYYNINGILNDIQDNVFKRNISTTHLGAMTMDDVEVGISFMDNSLDEYILAPTQSLLQKWLEEKYYVFINTKTNTSVNEILETEFSLVSWKFPPIQLDYYKDKYEGLEIALQEALKLI